MPDRQPAPSPGLTEHEMEAIAERAAERALQKVYAEVGRSVVNRVLWIVGAVALGFAVAKGWWKA